MTRSTYTDAERQAFGRAFSAALDASGLNPPALAERLSVTDDAVRKWRNGMVPSGPQLVYDIEAALALQPGELSRHLGFRPLDTPASALDAIDADPSLDETTRPIILAAYRAARDQAEPAKPARHLRAASAKTVADPGPRRRGKPRPTGAESEFE